MNKTSILLALDGSESAYQAAQLALHLKQTNGALVTAQHVIDTRTAWRLLGAPTDGLIGSGLYIAAYQSLCESLLDLGNQLAQRYEAISSDKGTIGECIIDKGSPFELILQRLQQHDLLLIGHEPASISFPNYEDGAFSRASLACALANASDKPILIVRQFKTYKTMKIFCAIDDIDQVFIANCSNIASMLGVAAELAILNANPKEQNSRLEREVEEACVGFEDMPKEIIDLACEQGSVALWSKKPFEIDLNSMSDSLLVVPTKKIDGKRTTIFGCSPGSFLRHLTVPQIMLYCQDRVEVAGKEVAQQRVVADLVTLVASNTG